MARLLRGVCLIALAISVFGFSLKEMPEFAVLVRPPESTLSSAAQRVLGEQLNQYKTAVDKAVDKDVVFKATLKKDIADGFRYSSPDVATVMDELFQSLYDQERNHFMDELFQSLNDQTFRENLKGGQIAMLHEEEDQGFFRKEFIDLLTDEDIKNIREQLSQYKKNVLDELTQVATVMDNLFQDSYDHKIFRDSLKNQGFFEKKFIDSLTDEDIKNIRKVYEKYGPESLDVTSIDEPNLFANKEWGTEFAEEGRKYAETWMEVAKVARLDESPKWWQELLQELSAKIKKFISSKLSKAAQAAKLAEKVKSQTDLVIELCGSKKYFSAECADLKDEVASIDFTSSETIEDMYDWLDAFNRFAAQKQSAQLESEATQYVNELWADEETQALSPEMKKLFEASEEKDEGKFMEDYFLKTAQESVDKNYKKYKEYKTLPDSDDTLTFKAWNKRNDDSVANDDDNQINDEDGPLANDDLTDEEMDGFMNTELTVEAKGEGAKVFDEAVSERADAAASKFVENGVFELGTVFADGTAIGGESATDMLKDEMGGMLEKLATKVV